MSHSVTTPTRLIHKKLFIVDFLYNIMTIKQLTIVAAAVLLPTNNSTAQNAQPEKTDSVEMFAFANPDGHGGLRIATRKPGEKKWKTPDKDFIVVNSDFGTWGAEKRMFNPELSFDATTDTWYLIFNPDHHSTVGAFTSSPDFFNWTPQEYVKASEVEAMLPASAKRAKASTEYVNDKEYSGSIITVPKSLINTIKGYSHYRKSLNAKYDELTDQDQWRFAGIDTVSMTVRLLNDGQKTISDKLIGIFFEDINYAADGGLYAELIQNRDFEYSPSDRGGDINWNALTAWSISNPDQGSVTIETVSPIHANNPHYARFKVNTKGVSLTNSGFDGIPVKKGEHYDLSLKVRAAQGGTLNIRLLDSNDKTVGAARLSAPKSDEWLTLNATIKATADCDSAHLSITPQRTGTYDLDMVSLFPQATFKGRKNGLRNDLATTLADLHPRFVRFPGGCVAHGDGVDNIYDWKGSIGPLEERLPKRNIWGYHQSRGLGYHEYFLFCEDIGAEPLPVLAAGVPCQNSSTHSHHSVDALTANGQQCGIPMEEMGAYVQDILDLVEYANGDVTTTWGAKRAAAGHPEPFNLKYIGIGNEDLITETFKTRFLMIYNALKQTYPEITVIGTVGPFYEGADYTAGWQFAREHNIPMVDEHYYVSPGWLIHNQHFYDSYPRGATKVYLGEYASHMHDRKSSLEAALSDALYLTSVERNGDVVEMTSYAPLLAKKDHTQWRPDLIYFDNNTINLTPDYYVQLMYGQNSGTTYVPSLRTMSTSNPDLRVRIGTSTVIDPETGDMIVKLVNMTPVTVNTTLDGVAKASAIRRTTLTGNPDDTDVKAVTDEISPTDTHTLPPYSFTVLRYKK